MAPMPMMLDRVRRAIVLAMLAASLPSVEDVRVLCSFEDDEQVRRWEYKPATAQPSDEHATHGKRSMRVDGGSYVTTTFYPGIAPGDWSGADALEIDVFVGGMAPLRVSVVVIDAAYQAKPTYWNRHNGAHVLRPGANTLTIPVRGLYRGEAGSRNNDLKTDIDPAAIRRFDLGFGDDATAPVWIDHIRLTREDRPEGIIAVDFGPESQAVFPGFTPVAWNTVAGQGGVTVGLRRALAGPTRGRDDTFLTRLYQDWVDLGQDAGGAFVAEVPNGTWHGWLVFSDAGYWGGEATRHRRRAVVVEGREVVVDDRGDAGPLDALHRFEDVEPMPGCDVWETYLASLFTGQRFTATVTDGRLDLTITGDTPWCGKVAALVLYPDARKAEAEAWIARVEARNRDEALARAVCLGPQPAPLAVPPEAAARGWWIGAPGLDASPAFLDAPGAPFTELTATAARGQRLALSFAVRALRDFPAATVTVGNLRGPSGVIPAGAADIRHVHHGLSRRPNGVAYTIAPVGLRPVGDGRPVLAKDLTRQFWITIDVPGDAKPGRYAGEATLSAGPLAETVPIAIEVLDVALDEVDFPRGFFGAGDPGAGGDEALTRAVLTLFRGHGMTTYSGGPDIRFDGLDAEGRPQLDFSPLDAFLGIARDCRMGGEAFRYGSLGWVRGLYEGPHRQAWEASGKPFGELLTLVWDAVHEHAASAGWPRINYGVIDEPRVLEQAREIRSFLVQHRSAVPALRLGGFFSVDWHRDDELSREIQGIFASTSWSAMNLHGDVDVAKAKELGVDLYLYNQGADRATHGAFAWARMHQGVRGHIGWHAFAVSGYQFFDLDGREPDYAMYHRRRGGIDPTLALARSAEGVTDLRLAATLRRVARAAGARPEAAEALTWLDAVVSAIPPSLREVPAELAGDGFRNGCIRRLRALLVR